MTTRLVLLVTLISLMWLCVSAGQAKRYRLGQTIELPNNLKLRLVGGAVSTDIDAQSIARFRCEIISASRVDKLEGVILLDREGAEQGVRVNPGDEVNLCA